jgi:hypothetical protein
MTHPLDGLAGGCNFSNKNYKVKEKKKKPKEYYVYKYSKGIPLAEQIIIGNKSVFLQVDAVRRPVISVRLDLSKDHGIVLLPQKDGLEGIASYTLPVKFKDLTEIKGFIEAAQHETIDSIYARHKRLWEKFVATNDDYTISFLAIDSTYSHFQDLFETTHSDLIDGAPGSGKGATLITFQLLGYRVVLAADLSGANILDLYGSNGRCQITLAEDELDDIKDDPIKRKLYKIGYDITGKTPRTLDGNTSSRASRLYEIFGLKIFGTEVASDDKLLGGFNDRNFRIESTKGKPDFRVKKVLMEMEKPIGKQSPKYKQIVAEVEYVRKLTFIFRMLHYNNMIEEVETNIDGRPLELTGPQIYLFASKELGSSYRMASSDDQRKNCLLIKEILPTLTKFLEKKGQLTKKTLQSVIWDALESLNSTGRNETLIIHSNSVPEVNTGRIRNLIEIAYELIYNKAKELTDGKDSTTLNEQAFYSADYGKITHRQILKICQNTFRGEPGRIDVTVSTGRIQTRSFIFDKDILMRVGKTFEAVTEVKVLEDGKEEQKSDATEQRNFGNYEEMRENEQSNTAGQSEGNISEASNKYASQDEELDKSQGIHIDHKNITQLQSDSNTTDSINENPDVYTSTASNSVAQLQEQPQRQDSRKEEEANLSGEGLRSSPDPYLAQVTKHLNNIRENFYEYQCSNCYYKEAVWKNKPKPKFCARCKTPSAEE